MEATGDFIPRVETVKKIIEQIKKKGLSGVAVTEHCNKDYGFRVKPTFNTLFSNDTSIF